jgi:hypothetical protein
MRNSKAKMLRIVARMKYDAPTIYKPYERVKFLQVPDEKDPKIIHTVRTKGTPRELDVCTRSVYKELKKYYKRS